MVGRAILRLLFYRETGRQRRLEDEKKKRLQWEAQDLTRAIRMLRLPLLRRDAEAIEGKICKWAGRFLNSVQHMNGVRKILKIIY